MATSREEMLRQIAIERGLIPAQNRTNELMQVAKERGLLQEPSFGLPKQILTEPLKAIGAGILGASAGGFAGATTAARSGFPEGQRVKQEVGGRIAQSGAPTTRIGQIGLEAIGDVGEAATRGIRTPLAYLAGRGEELIGDPQRAEEISTAVREQGFLPTISNRLLDAGVINPEVAGTLQVAPEIAGLVAGGGLAVGRNIAASKKVADQLKQKQKQNKELTVYKEGIKETETPLAELAQYKLTRSGKAVRDDTFKPLVKRGMDPAVLAEYKASSNSTKDAMLKMIDIKKRGMENPRFGSTNRPADVVGENLLPRINRIKGVNKRAGRQIDAAANGLRGKTIDFTQPFNEFVDNLDEMGINLRGALQDPEFFTGSKAQVISKIRKLYDGSDLDLMPGFQKPLTNVIYKSRIGDSPDAFDLHKLKRFIDQNVTYGKTQTGLSARVEGMLKNLRHDIDTALDSNFPVYKRANDTYSETITALDDFQSVLPRKVNLDMKNIEKALGQEMRKLESNFQVRTSLLNSLGEIERVSRKYGGEYDDDLWAQASFMTDIDQMFGATGRNTFEGRIVRGVEQAVSDKSTRRRVAEFISEKLSPDDEEAFRMLREMIDTSSEWQ